MPDLIGPRALSERRGLCPQGASGLGGRGDLLSRQGANRERRGKTGPCNQAVGGRRMSAGFLEEAAAELGLEDLAVRKVGVLRGPQSGRREHSRWCGLSERVPKAYWGRSPGEVAMGMGLNWTP